jgi:phosphoglycerate dehydrogenase-like enzyme
MRIVFRGQAFEADVAEFAARRGLDFFAARDEAELLDALPAADALWITPTCYTSAVASAVCANPGRLKWLGLTSAGYDVLLRNGAPPGVTLTYATSVHGPAVAEHAVSLLLALVRRLPVSFAAQGRHAWDPSVIAGLRSLEDLSVGIVGMGAIGGAIAERLRPLCKRIIGISRSGAADARADAMFATEQLRAAFAQCDAAILTVTLSEETRGLIDAAALRALPAGALLVNVSRGPVVDGPALARALTDGRLAGAALDVTEPEPLPPDDSLWTAPGVIITPHVGSFGSRATGKRLAEQYERNVDRFLRGDALEGSIAYDR